MLLQILLDYNFFLEQAGELHTIFLRNELLKVRGKKIPPPNTTPWKHLKHTQRETGKDLPDATHKVVGDQLTQKIGLAAVNVLYLSTDKLNDCKYDQLYMKEHINIYDTK
jgi:hypothetical protein